MAFGDPIQKGIAVAWGTSGTGEFRVAGGGSAYLVKATGIDLSKDAEVEEHRDPQTGSVIGLTFFNPSKEASLKVFPTTSGITTAAAVVLPEIGDSFEIYGGATSALDSDIAPTAGASANNKYIVMKCSKSRVNNGRVNFDVTIKRYATDLSTTVTP